MFFLMKIRKCFVQKLRKALGNFTYLSRGILGNLTSLCFWGIIGRYNISQKEVKIINDPKNELNSFPARGYTGGLYKGAYTGGRQNIYLKN